MTVSVQGTRLQLSPTLRARIDGRPDIFPLPLNPALLTAAWNQLEGRDLALASMEELFRTLLAAYNAAVLAQAAAVAAQWINYRNALRSVAMIMQAVPQPQRCIRLSQIPAVHQPHVRTVIGAPGTIYASPPLGVNGLCRGTHNTDPMTGNAGAGHREYQLPDPGGGRMTRRNHGGSLAFYYSQGGHAYNQYTYYLITDNAGHPLLRGNYPAAFQAPLP